MRVSPDLMLISNNNNELPKPPPGLGATLLLNHADTPGGHDEGGGSRESTSSHHTVESSGIGGGVIELDGPLIASGELDCSYCRKPFKQPRLLMCLHTFCEQCIVAMLERSSSLNCAPSAALDNGLSNGGSRCSSGNLDFGALKPSPTAFFDETTTTESKLLLDCELETPIATGETQPPPGVVRCPICKQDSQIGNDLRFVQTLQSDYVTMNLQDANALEHMQLLCESCKSKEKAVARCVDCASVLCQNCVQAHQFMRCFENHKVMTFEEIRNSDDGFIVHKPILCQSHPTEHVRLFCATCRMPVCNECLLSTHKFMDHNYIKPSSETDATAREHLKVLVSRGEKTISRCDTENQEIENKLKDLQSSVDQAKVSIEYTFEKYQSVLESRRQSLITDLASLQTELEAKILRTSQQISNTSEKIHDAISFTERLLKHGNAMELLCSMSVVEVQLRQVIHSVPSSQFAVKVNFVNDEKLFADSLVKSAGYFYAGLENKPPESCLAVDALLNPVTTTMVNQYRSIASPSQQFSGNAAAFATTGSTPFSLTASVQPTAAPTLHANPMSVPNFHAAPFEMGVAATGGTGSAFSQVLPASRSGLMTPVFPQGALSGVLSPTTGLVNGTTDYSVFGGRHNQSGHQALSHGLLDLASAVATNGHHPPQQPQHSSGWLDGITTGGIERALSELRVGTASATMPSSLDGWSNAPPPLNLLPHAGGLTPPSDSGSSGGGHHSSLGMMGGAGGPYQTGSMSNMYSQNMLTASGGPGGAFTGLNPPIRQCPQMNSISIRCKIGSLGPTLGQFNSPHGFCLSPSEDIVVADTNNHRIQIFDKQGQYKGQFGVAGKDEGQLWYPRKVAILRQSGKFIVCDRGNERSRMQIFNRAGNFIKKIAIRYIDIVAGLCVDRDGHVIAVDSVSPTVFCIDENGELLHWFDCSTYMKEPSDIAVYGSEYFICDFKGHCVCVFSLQGEFLRKIGGEGVTNFPNGIDISDAGDILVGDSHGNRFHVAVFRRNGELQVEYECPWAKNKLFEQVSRCCGLRITSEGLLITIAKNNHHVLIMDTLYVG